MKFRHVGTDYGFTLLEMLVALVVAAAALSIALPTIAGNSEGRRLELAANSLVNMLNAARSEAMARGTSSTVLLEATSARYAIDGGTWRQLAPGVSVATQPNLLAITFRSDGSSTDTAIGLRAGQRAATIRIDWLSGSASVEFSR